MDMKDTYSLPFVAAFISFTITWGMDLFTGTFSLPILNIGLMWLSAGFFIRK